VEQRIKDGFEANIGEIQNDGYSLVQKLNAKLLELDKLNEEKRLLSVDLIEKIKFVRDLQGQLGTADVGSVTDVIDKELES